MGTVSKKFGFIRATLAMWTGNLFAGRAGVVTDSTPGPVERWGWYDGSAWKFSARSGANESFGSLALSSHLTLNGATRPAWDADSHVLTAENDVAIFTTHSIAGGAWTLALNAMLSGGGWKVVDSNSLGSSQPRLLQASTDGSIKYYVDNSAAPVAGAAAVLVPVLSISRQGGIGFFGVTPPASRPTVNAAATDLATVIALTNQLRTHLIACGLVQ